MADKVVPIVKPDEFDLNQFKSKRGASVSDIRGSAARHWPDDSELTGFRCLASPTVAARSLGFCR